MSPTAPPPPSGPDPASADRDQTPRGEGSPGPRGLRLGEQPLQLGNDAAATLLRWGRNWLRREQAVGLPEQPAVPVDPLQECSKRLRGAREAHGLSLRQLAQDTRISTAVLEALEKGWRDRLPEPTYLRTMLSLLEQHLALAPGSLEGALPASRLRSGEQRGDRPQGQTLSLPSIELLGTWQGGVAYALLCLALIYGLNRQQQHLASLGLLSLRPIPASPAGEAAASGDASENSRILVAFPDLQPLERARQGQALLLLRRQNQAATRRADGAGGGSNGRGTPAHGSTSAPGSPPARPGSGQPQPGSGPSAAPVLPSTAGSQGPAGASGSAASGPNGSSPGPAAAPPTDQPAPAPPVPLPRP